MTDNAITNRTPRRHVAIHEAGHAVIAAAIGLRFTRASIVRDGSELGHVELHYPRPGEMRSLRYIHNRVMFGFAGGIADTMYRDGIAGPGDGDGIINDLCDVVMLAKRLPGCRHDTDARARQLSSLHDRTETLVRIHWSLITRVADLLLERHTLSEAEVRGVVGRA